MKRSDSAFAGRLATGMLAASALAFCPAHTWAAASGTAAPRSAPHGVARPLNAQAAQKEALSASFDLKGMQHAVYDFTAEAPGKITISLQVQGAPVMLTLVKPGGEQVTLSTAAPIEYPVTANDLNKGKQWKADIALAVKAAAPSAARFSMDTRASGHITIQAMPAGGDTAQGGAAGHNVRLAAAGSAAARVTDQPPPVAPAALAQTVASKRKDEFAPGVSGNSNTNPQNNQTGQQGTNQTGGHGSNQTGGQGYDQTGGQGYDQTGGQGYDQTGGQGYDQTGGQGYDQTGGQGTNPYYDPNQGQYPQDPYQQGQYTQPETPIQSPLQQQSPQSSGYTQSYQNGQPYQGAQPYQNAQPYQGQQPAYQGQQQSYQGQQPQYQAQPNMPGGMPAGSCAVKLSTDRSTILMVDSMTGTERKHLSLGQDRVQKVFSSPDNAWSVAVYKVRGVQQYGFIALELGKCEDQLPVELTAVPSEARFDQSEVVLVIDSKEKHFPLRNSRMQ